MRHHPHMAQVRESFAATAGFVAAFLVGLLGWLAVAALRPAEPWLSLAPFAVGLAGAAVAPRPLALVAVLLGIGLSYPVALELGVMSYLGENVGIHLARFLAAASAGIGAVLLAIAAFRGVTARSG